MKKKILIVAASIFMLIALTGAVSAYCGNRGTYYIDDNGDGICDNRHDCYDHSYYHHTYSHGHHHHHGYDC